MPHQIVGGAIMIVSGQPERRREPRAICNRIQGVRVEIFILIIIDEIEIFFTLV
jgi:hypothetical protein